jgi:hypothetical protein
MKKKAIKSTKKTIFTSKGISHSDLSAISNLVGISQIGHRA